MDGFLCIHKASGMTSFDVIRKIKKKFHIDKVGHVGTLDPMASGLLILCIGKATKLAYLLQESDKSYEGEIVFGTSYDTYDITGKVIDQSTTLLTKEEILAGIKYMTKTYDQIPPMYSAVKKNGQKMYELARQGKHVDIEPRSVDIKRFEALSLTENHVSFTCDVSKGTYIRSLAYDLGRYLDTYGALSRLKRVRIGDYHLDQAKTIEAVELSDLIPLKELFKHVDRLVLNDYLIQLVKNGIYLDERQIKTDKPFIVVDHLNNDIAYYEIKSSYVYYPVLQF